MMSLRTMVLVVGCAASLAAAQTTVRVLPIVANDIKYNPQDGRIYAAVSLTGGGAQGQSVAAIDPVSGAVVASVQTPLMPRHMAVTDSGQHIFVSMGGTSRGTHIGRLDTSTLNVETPFSVDPVPQGCSRTVWNLQAAPGSETGVVVSRFGEHPCLNHAGIVLFENGSLQPASVPAFPRYYGLARSRSPDVIWGHRWEPNTLPGTEIHRLQVISTGIAIEQTYLGLLNQPALKLEGDVGAIYAQSGEKIDAGTGMLLGTFPTPTGGTLIEPDSQNRRFWMVAGVFPPALSVYDDESFARIAEIPLSMPGFERDLIRWGIDGLAIRTSEAIVLINTPLVHQLPCYPNCDYSTTAPTLNVADFTCFLMRFAAGHAYANCDGSSTNPGLNVQDFTCFLQRYAAGCP
jgi:hypothetical protein